jgi:hypothetical protein
MFEMPRLRPKLISIPLIFIISGAFVPSLPAHVHSGEALVPAQWQDAHPGSHSISLTVVVDEEWQRVFGPDAEEQARRVVEVSAAHLRPADIDLRIAALETWTSDDDGDSLHGLLDELELSRGPIETDMVIGLTAGQYAGKVDGVARPRRPYVVVKHHPRHPERDAYVLTHEIGHVLGLDHHACPDGRCFMADHQYDLREHWCSDHLEILRANGGYFHYVQDAGLQT